MRITPARPQPVSMLFGQDPLTVAQSAPQTGKTLLMIVKYNFAAERADELEVREGEALICFAITNKEWVLAKPITRLGGPGLVPIEYLTVISRAGKPCESAEVAIDELRAAGIPSTAEWKRLTAEYKDATIPLGYPKIVPPWAPRLPAPDARSSLPSGDVEPLSRH